MKLTTKSEYSLLAMIYIARHQSERYVKIEEISTYYKISKKYLEHLLFILKQNHYITTKRGANGGYCLNKKPSEITLAEIIRLMDGALAPVESVSHYFYQSTPLEKEEKVIGVFKEIRDFIADKMERTTLESIL